MNKNLRSLAYTVVLCFSYAHADDIDLNNVVKVLNGTSTANQAQSSVLSQIDPTGGKASSLIQQALNNKPLESPTSELQQGGVLYVFQNETWNTVTKDDDFTGKNVALLIHDLTQDKSHLHNLASILSNIPKDLSTGSSNEKYFQLIFAFEYPSMKSFENKDNQKALISSVGETMAGKLMIGGLGTKSLTILAHGVGGVLTRYVLEKELPSLKEFNGIKFNEADHKNIYKKINLITLGAPHSGIPKQVAESAYKSFVGSNISDVLTSNIQQQENNYLEQQKNNLLGTEAGAIINLFAPNALSNVTSAVGGIHSHNISDSLPVIKEIESGSQFLASLNSNTFSYADQTNYFTIAGTKSTEFQIGLGDKQTEVGTAVQSIYASADSTVQSDGLVSQYSANAKELGNVCVNWAKDNSNRSYTLAVNHAELIGNSSNQAFIQQVLPVFIKILGLSKALTDSPVTPSVDNTANSPSTTPIPDSSSSDTSTSKK